MKIRSGFVSNSSTSSFILVDGKDGLEKEHDEMTIEGSVTLNEIMLMFVNKAAELGCDVKDLKLYYGIDYC